jgi:dTDP-glucose 4,6-dehydratase
MPVDSRGRSSARSARVRGGPRAGTDQAGWDRGTPRIPAAARLLVTGGAGFIGSAFVRDVLARRDGTRITVLDKLTYAGNRANLAAAEADPEQAARFRFVQGDIADPETVDPLVADCDAVVNFAAESHVDRSILDPEAFLRTGVIGVHVLLEAVRAGSAARMAAGKPAIRHLQVSTDEVYGSVETGRSRETDALAPRSPYSAAKAAGELLVHSYVATHGLDAVVTRGSNTYGPFHHPEKLIPLFVTNAIDDLPLPLYGDGLQQRDWLFVSDHAGAIDHVLRFGASGETYNIAGSAEMTNRAVVTALLERLGKPWTLVRSVPDRLGHDRRYALDGSKLAALGWHNRISFADGLASTVDWFVANEPWWRAAKSGDWGAYYERQYGARLAAGQAVAQVAGPGEG